MRRCIEVLTILWMWWKNNGRLNDGNNPYFNCSRGNTGCLFWQKISSKKDSFDCLANDKKVDKMEDEPKK